MSAVLLFVPTSFTSLTDVGFRRFYITESDSSSGSDCYEYKGRRSNEQKDKEFHSMPERRFIALFS